MWMIIHTLLVEYNCNCKFSKGISSQSYKESPPITFQLHHLRDHAVGKDLDEVNAMLDDLKRRRSSN